MQAFIAYDNKHLPAEISLRFGTYDLSVKDPLQDVSETERSQPSQSIETKSKVCAMKRIPQNTDLT
jgi:hypothetical protein